MSNVVETPSRWDELGTEWATVAEENVQEWGQQDIETLLLATQEELGELTQAFLEAKHEGNDPERIFEELTDLAALMFQLQWTLEWEFLNDEFRGDSDE